MIARAPGTARRPPSAISNACRRLSASLVFVLALSAFGRTALAATTAEIAVTESSGTFISPSTSVYTVASGTVGEVLINNLNVFDPRVPGEDWWPFQMANKIHIQTKPYIIRREMLLEPGQTWDPLKALETERNLRASGFLRKAEVRPLGTHGRLDLEVHTQDSWTLQPQMSLGTEGGDRYLIYGIEENNILGYGKAISLYHAQVGPVLRNELRYEDPRVWGSRVHWVSLFGDTNQSGSIAGQFLEHPFYSLDTPYAWQLLWTRIIQEDTLYQNGDQTTQFIQNFRSVESQYGKRIGGGSLVQRAYAGTHYEHDFFLTETDTTQGTLPNDRTLIGPTAGYSLVQPNYIKETYINRMQRVEDFNLGNEFTVNAGAMMTALGSDADRWTFNALDQQGLSLGEGRFLLGQIGTQGRLRHDALENTIYYASLNAFVKSWFLWPQTWVAHVEGNSSQALDGEKQIILGGSTGLRGYRNYAFTGSRSILANLENRFFFPKEFFHLFYVGGVAFVDSGAVVPQNSIAAWEHAKSDVGMGFRFGPTRSVSGDVARMDVAYALNSGPGPSRWVVSIRGGQAFDIFSSTNKSALQSPESAITEQSAGDRLRHR